jgi:ABC-type proline/glycine betaine transport system ATPase subunit
MDLSQIAASIPLRSGQPLRVQNAFGRRIAVLEGHVWVTQDGDPRDIVLSPGDDFVFDRHADAMLSSLGGDARVVREEGMTVGASA